MPLFVVFTGIMVWRRSLRPVFYYTLGTNGRVVQIGGDSFINNFFLGLQSSYFYFGLSQNNFSCFFGGVDDVKNVLSPIFLDTLAAPGCHDTDMYIVYHTYFFNSGIDGSRRAKL